MTSYRFIRRSGTFFFDFNEAIRAKVCELIDLHPKVAQTASYGFMDFGGRSDDCVADFRNLISPKISVEADVTFIPRGYYQVFREKHGFLPNLSVVDLLFNMGPNHFLFCVIQYKKMLANCYKIYELCRALRFLFDRKSVFYLWVECFLCCKKLYFLLCRSFCLFSY